MCGGLPTDDAVGQVLQFKFLEVSAISLCLLPKELALTQQKFFWFVFNLNGVGPHEYMYIPPNYWRYLGFGHLGKGDMLGTFVLGNKILIKIDCYFAAAYRYAPPFEGQPRDEQVSGLQPPGSAGAGDEGAVSRGRRRGVSLPKCTYISGMLFATGIQCHSMTSHRRASVFFL